jgi:transcriptional regulator with XRE-family HTH domain
MRDRARFNEMLRSSGFATQRAFADKVALDGPKMTNLLRGKRRPQIVELAAMARVLNVPMAALLECWFAPPHQLEEGPIATPLILPEEERARHMLTIWRVANGWVVSPGDSHISRYTHVATNPEDLAEHVERWARSDESC